MNNWFEEWESTYVKYGNDYLEKIEESDETVKPDPKRKKRREVAWVRKHNFKVNQVRQFYKSVWGRDLVDDDGDCFMISDTLKNHYVTNANKPTHIRRIEGEHNYYTWAGPKWNRYKRRVTNRHIRQNKTFEPIARTKAVFKANGPRSYD